MMNVKEKLRLNILELMRIDRSLFRVQFYPLFRLQNLDSQIYGQITAKELSQTNEISRKWAKRINKCRKLNRSE